jgi:hypothetical protein
LEEVTVHAGHEVLIVVDLFSLIVGDPQWIFRPAAQASPNPLIKYQYFIY